MEVFGFSGIIVGSVILLSFFVATLVFAIVLMKVIAIIHPSEEVELGEIPHNGV